MNKRLGDSYALLDRILRHLQDTTDKEPNDLETDLANLSKFEDIAPRDRRAAIEKLRHDRYISSIILNDGSEHNQFKVYKPMQDYYYITFEGLLLLGEDGYVGKAKSANAKEYRQTKYQILTVWWIGIAAVYYVLELVRLWVLPHFCQKDCYRLVTSLFLGHQ